MKGSFVAALAVAGLLAAPPVMAQLANAQSAALPNRTETVPLRLSSSQIMQIQQRLNQEGFNAGPVDGNWGPETAEAVRDFQIRKGMEAAGGLDLGTLAALGVQMRVGEAIGSQQ